MTTRQFHRHLQSSN